MDAPLLTTCRFRLFVQRNPRHGDHWCLSLVMVSGGFEVTARTWLDRADKRPKPPPFAETFPEAQTLKRVALAAISVATS